MCVCVCVCVGMCELIMKKREDTTRSLHTDGKIILRKLLSIRHRKVYVYVGNHHDNGIACMIVADLPPTVLAVTIYVKLPFPISETALTLT